MLQFRLQELLVRGLDLQALRLRFDEGDVLIEALLKG